MSREIRNFCHFRALEYKVDLGNKGGSPSVEGGYGGVFPPGKEKILGVAADQNGFCPLEIASWQLFGRAFAFWGS